MPYYMTRCPVLSESCGAYMGRDEGPCQGDRADHKERPHVYGHRFDGRCQFNVERGHTVCFVHEIVPASSPTNGEKASERISPH